MKLLSSRGANERVGTSAGTVAMLSTVGSVLGTFGAGFVLIPLLGLKAIFVLVGLTLLVLAAAGYVGLNNPRSAGAAGAVLALGALATVLVFVVREPVADYVILRRETPYHQISVLQRELRDGREITILLTDGAPQGAVADQGERLVYHYPRYYRLERIFCPEVERAAFLGGGVYGIPRCLADDHPQAEIDVVEIDPEIERIGRELFGLDDYADRVRPQTGDARMFLAASGERYDLIFGDVFRGRQTVPPHLVTREFFDLVRRRLADEGIYMMNLIGSLEGPQSRFSSSVVATLHRVFGEVYVFETRADASAGEVQNLVIVAPARPLGLEKDDLVARAAGDPRLERMAANLAETGVPDADGLVLTDDYSPVEYLIARQLSRSRGE